MVSPRDSVVNWLIHSDKRRKKEKEKVASVRDCRRNEVGITPSDLCTRGQQDGCSCPPKETSN